MKIIGYVLAIPDLLQILYSDHDLVNHLFNTKPHATNYTGKEISQGYYKTTPDQILHYFIKLKCNDSSCKIILTQEQYDYIKIIITDKILRPETEIVPYNYEIMDHNSGDNMIRGYKVRCQDLQNIKITLDNLNFFKTVPLGTNCYKSEKSDNYIFDDTYPNTKKSLRKIMYSRLPDKLCQYAWYKRNLSPGHYLLLSHRQYLQLHDEQIFAEQITDINAIICYNNPVINNQSMPIKKKNNQCTIS